MSDDLKELIHDVVVATKEDSEQTVSELLATKEPSEAALLLESLPVSDRRNAWDSIKESDRLATLLAMRGDPRETLIDAMSLEDLDKLFVGIAAEDLLDLEDALPTRLVDRALRIMDEKQRGYYQDAQQYNTHQAGHWVNRDLLALPLNARVRDGMRLLRRQLPEYTDAIYLVDRIGHFSAAVRISEIIKAQDHIPLVDLTEDIFPVVNAKDDAVDAAKKVQVSGYSAIPLVDEAGKMLGRMHIGNGCEIVNQFLEGQVMANAGLDEDEDLFSPVFKSAKNRALWLGINLLTAFIASWFIGLFEATLQQVVALAVLMPVVASMGGIAGSQTLTLIIRGLALNQVTKENRSALLKKELQVGGLNGIVWAIVIGIVASLWFGTALIGLVIGLAILANILAAALSGVWIPMILEKLKLDPALSGSVILTTVTDIVGFVSFLGLGTLLLV